MSAKIIAIGNQKGGVGKTTTSITLGHYFAQRGKRVMIVDLDSQGHTAVGLGVKPSNGLLCLLVNHEPIKKVVTTVRENLDIITNDHTAETVKAHVLQTNFREYMIGTALENADYDLIFLDMPPSTNILHVSALVASDYLIMPSIMDYLSIEGVTKIMGTAYALKNFPNVEPPKILGVLPTMVERVTSETDAVMNKLEEAIGTKLVLPSIPVDTRIREASHRGLTIWEYAPRTRAAVGYKNGDNRTSQNSLGLTGGYLHIAEIIEGVIS